MTNRNFGSGENWANSAAGSSGNGGAGTNAAVQFMDAGVAATAGVRAGKWLIQSVAQISVSSGAKMPFSLCTDLSGW